MNAKQRKAYAAWLGSRTSAKKAQASRENGKKGGRPVWWVWDCGEWTRPSKAVRTGKGWLHAQWRDGTIALIRPGRFVNSAEKPDGPPVRPIASSA